MMTVAHAVRVAFKSPKSIIEIAYGSFAGLLATAIALTGSVGGRLGLLLLCRITSSAAATFSIAATLLCNSSSFSRPTTLRM